MAEVSQRPEPGNNRWSFLRHLPNLLRRGERSKPAMPTAEDLRRQEREEHGASLVTKLMSHYRHGDYKETLTGPGGQKATLDVHVYAIKSDSPLAPERPLGYVELKYTSPDDKKRMIRWSRSGSNKEMPQNLEEKGILYCGREEISGQFPTNLTSDTALDAWEEWEPSISALIATRKATESSL